MLRLVEVLGSVFVARVVAAADVSAGKAKAQVHPVAPQPQALLAALGRSRRNGSNLGQVRASMGFHELLNRGSPESSTGLAATGGHKDPNTIFRI